MSLPRKQAERVISLDIGSTFTKAALFQIENDHMRILASARFPTTNESLGKGVFRVLQEIECIDTQSPRPKYPVWFSSSAKGGLHVVAVGLTPELTLKVGTMAALSAGARVTKTCGYKLTESDIHEIDQLAPDIILFTGGTDGGNETFVRHNAQFLAKLDSRPQIIYAGNQSMCTEIKELLSAFDLHITDNVLPELDRYCVDQAQQKIGEVFLSTIVAGKGLDEVVDLLGREPFPTPMAVMHLVEVIGQNKKWSDFCLVDLGGATTDFYSCNPDPVHESQVIYRGLTEPDIKRTVEGDLGLRCNAPSVLIAGSEMLKNSKSSSEMIQIIDYINKVTQKTGYLPKTIHEKEYDHLLADICVTQAIRRHAGTRKRVFTGQGQVYIQTGKDLRDVQKMILTGGYLSRLKEADGFGNETFSSCFNQNNNGDIINLVPQDVHYYQDRDCLFPLLGNLVKEYPHQAVQTAIENLAFLESIPHQPMENPC